MGRRDDGGSVAVNVLGGGGVVGSTIAVASAALSGAGNVARSMTGGRAVAGAVTSAATVGMVCGASGSGAAAGSANGDSAGVVAPAVLPAGPSASSTPPLPVATAPEIGGAGANHS